LIEEARREIHGERLCAGAGAAVSDFAGSGSHNTGSNVRKSLVALKKHELTARMKHARVIPYFAKET
jgi:hypothetical protein